MAEGLTEWAGPNIWMFNDELPLRDASDFGSGWIVSGLVFMDHLFDYHHDKVRELHVFTRKADHVARAK